MYKKEKAKLLQWCLNFCNPVKIFVACQAPQSMGFSRQEYWSGLPFPSPEDLPDPGVELEFPVAPALQADSLLLSQLGSPDIHIHVSVLFQKLFFIYFY